MNQSFLRKSPQTHNIKIRKQHNEVNWHKTGARNYKKHRISNKITIEPMDILKNSLIMKYTQHEKRWEAHVILQEVDAIIVVQEDQKESDHSDKNNEHQRIEKGALKLLRGGIGGAF